MGKYSTENWKKIEKALKVKLPKIQELSVIEVSALADEIMSYMMSNVSYDKEDKSGLPFYTGNLLDSTGIGVYLNGVLVAVRASPQRSADTPQHINGETYWGADKLQDALNMATSLGHGLVLRIFSASPIAAEINSFGSPWDRGQDYFDDISQFAIQAATRRFKK